MNTIQISPNKSISSERLNLYGNSFALKDNPDSFQAFNYVVNYQN